MQFLRFYCRAAGCRPYIGWSIKDSSLTHFREGSRLEIAWDKYPSLVFPLEAPWLRTKGIIYLIIGVLVAIGSAIGFWKILLLLTA